MGVALRDIVADFKETVTWQDLAGVAAVDAHNALYQFLSIIRQPDGTPLMDRNGRVTSHLSGILFRASNLLAKGIRTVWIYDGAPPPFKRETIEERRVARELAGERWKEALLRGDTEEAYRQARSSSRIDEEIIATSRELLSLLGLPWIQAPSEGEAQAAHMVARGAARYVVSQDYDTLLFGAPVLVRNLTVSGKRKVRGRTLSVVPERLLLTEVLAGLGISRADLIRIGILVGTDFNEGIKGVGAKTALRVVRNGEFEQVMRERQPGLDWEEIYRFFENPPVTDDYTLRWRPPDREGVLRMLCDRFDFSPERVEGALGEVKAATGQKTLDSWF
ncbi:MAG: flap endonuclease-1 [Methanolinea sp.]